MSEIRNPPAEGSETLYVKKAGAKWDGVTDDSAALQSAVETSAETGRPIELPPGPGVVNSIPTIPKNLSKPVVIRGVDKEGTTVKLPEALQFLQYATTAPGDTVGNVVLSDFTVDGNNQPHTGGTVPVVLGNNSNTQQQVDVRNVTVQRLRTVNVPVLEAQENGRRSLTFQVYHKEPGLSRNTIDNINVLDCDFNGSQYGVFVAGIKGGEPLPLNVYIGKVNIGRVRYINPNIPTAFGYCAGVQIGQYGWSDGKQIRVWDIYSENSPDVAHEFDVPCLIRGVVGVNGNNSNLLLNCFNPTTTTDPVVAKLTSEATVGVTKLEVSSTTGFAVGQQIVLYGSEVKTCECRTIKAIGAGSLELTEAIAMVGGFAAGTWLSQVDVTGGVMQVEDFQPIRTAVTPGNSRGLTIQNIENPIPAPGMRVNGLYYRRSWKGVPANSGEAIHCQFGNAVNATGNPRFLRVDGIQLDIPTLENSAASKVPFSPIRLKMEGESFPLELKGEINVSGPGVTGAGQIPANLVKLIGRANVDIDLIPKGVIGSTGGEPLRFITLNEEAAVGSLSGRIRARVRQSSIASGGGSIIGVRFGKGCGFASTVTRTKTTAKVEAGATSVEVESASGFTAGMAIVLDAESTTKSEVFSIEKIEGNKLFLVPVLNAGAAVEHASGVVVARLNAFLIEDSDFTGLGTEGTMVAAEDSKVTSRLITKGTTAPKPVGSSAITIPESGKIQQILQSGQSGTLQFKGGTVSKIEVSSNGSSFFQVASSSNVGIHVNSGDFFKPTYSVVPEAINFIPDRA